MSNRGRILIVALAASVLGGTQLAAQNVTVRGRVLEQGTGDPVAGASVELSGSRQVVTSANGTFVIGGVRPGRRTLTVSMLGYRQHQSSVEVRSDTMLTVELEVEALRIDPLTVRARSITLRGQVTDPATRLPIMDADVLVGRDGKVLTNSMGRFRVGRIPANQPVTVQVRALGYMPVVVSVTPAQDTVLDFALEPDPISARMIAAQIGRLEERTKKVPFITVPLSRTELMTQYYNWTAADVVNHQLLRYGRVPICVFIDNVQQPYGLAQLATYVPDQIERIELVDRGTMVRVYTRRYIQRMMGERTPLPSIVLIKELGDKGCF